MRQSSRPLQAIRRITANASLDSDGELVKNANHEDLTQLLAVSLRHRRDGLGHEDYAALLRVVTAAAQQAVQWELVTGAPAAFVASE